MRKLPLIVLLTDFGTSDTFVGVMKGVIASICGHARTIDLTHAISPQNVREAAFHLDRSLSFFPDGSIFVCVVDPGVGSARRPICVEAGPFRFVAPDNGLLTPVFERYPDAHCHLLSEARYHLPAPSATFHGRDIFSPVAAHLAAGLPIERTGTAVALSSCARIGMFRNIALQNRIGWQGEVVSIDRFGNIVTSFDAGMISVGSPWAVSAGTADDIPLLNTYCDVGHGEPLAYIGSSGMVEIAVRNGNASREFHICQDTPLHLTRK
jgi:S-adenosyl-L-methionine hydrolase (adenosine-forming)